MIRVELRFKGPTSSKVTKDVQKLKVSDNQPVKLQDLEGKWIEYYDVKSVIVR